MPISPFSAAGQVGLNFDVAPAEMVPQAWNVGENIRFDNGSVTSVRGDVSLGLDLSSSEQPIWAFAVSESIYTTVAWVLPAAPKAYAYYNGALSDITRVSGDYTGDNYDRWSGGTLSSLLFLTNGVDVPQYWADLNPAIPLVDLPNWQAGVYAKCLRSFKNFLIALDVTKASVRYRTMVKWSHPADPGLPPPSWDETDTTKDAGEYSLTESAGACVDAVPLRDALIIYKEDSVWGMQFIGGTFIFRFYKIFSSFGMPQRDCAVEFQSGQHLVFSGDDLILHDGTTFLSVADGKVRTLLRQISIEQYAGCYMVNHIAQHEVWFCFRRASDGLPQADTALIYDWKDKTFGIRDLDNLYTIQPGKIPPFVLQWVQATYSWLNSSQEWDELARTSSIPRLFGVADLDIRWLDVTSYLGEAAKVERTYLGVAMRAGEAPDLASRKFLTRIWPRISGVSNEIVLVTIGAVDAVDKAIRWSSPRQYIIGTTEKLDFTIQGKMFAIRLSSLNAHNWVFSGADSDIAFIGGN